MDDHEDGDKPCIAPTAPRAALESLERKSPLGLESFSEIKVVLEDERA